MPKLSFDEISQMVPFLIASHIILLCHDCNYMICNNALIIYNINWRDTQTKFSCMVKNNTVRPCHDGIDTEVKEASKVVKYYV